MQLNHSGKSRLIEEELDGYIKNSGTINRDLECESPRNALILISIDRF